MKENDIRPADLMKLKEPALEHDKEFLRSRVHLFVNVDCPACKTTEHSYWAEKEGFSYSRCAKCDTVFMNPRASSELLEEFYTQSKNYEFWNTYIFPASDQVRKEKIFIPRAQRLIGYCQRFGISGTMLEIGAAYGTFCDAVMEQDFFEEIIALELTPSLAETCRKKGFKVIETPVEQLDLPENSIDVIANFEVLEHLSNPSLFIEQATKYLKPGGLFVCSCPNGKGLGMLVLKEKAGYVDHEHVNYFNPQSLSVLLESNGLDVLEVTTPGELDTDMLKNIYQKQPELFDEQPFFQHLLTQSESTLASFQSFVKEQCLSSHLWIIGRKRHE